MYLNFSFEYFTFPIFLKVSFFGLFQLKFSSHFRRSHKFICLNRLIAIIYFGFYGLALKKHFKHLLDPIWNFALEGSCQLLVNKMLHHFSPVDTIFDRLFMPVSELISKVNHQPGHFTGDFF